MKQSSYHNSISTWYSLFCLDAAGQWHNFWCHTAWPHMFQKHTYGNILDAAGVAISQVAGHLPGS